MAITLASVSRGRRLRAPKIVVYSAAKLGKSSLAAEMEDVVFICTEEGIDALDVAAFPTCRSWSDVMACIEVLATSEHDFKSVAVDSLDWAEQLLWTHVAQLHRVAGIEEVGGGYGKGYIEAAKHWREFLDALDYLRNERGMVVMLIAHDAVKQVAPPDGDPYSRNVVKLHDRAMGLVLEWADIIAAIAEKRFTRKTDQGFGKEHVRAIKSGQRVLILGKDPAYVTGNRFSLPDEIPYTKGEGWAALTHAMSAAASGGKDTAPAPVAQDVEA